jgi:hypothetical protein
MALKALARRSAVPVRLCVRVEDRLPEPMDVQVETVNSVLHVRVRDDGRKLTETVRSRSGGVC